MFNPIIEAIVCSLLPIIELRGGIPLAIFRGISIYGAFIICVLANIFVIPLVFYFLDTLHGIFIQNRYYNKIFNKYIENKRNLLEKHINSKWEFISLMLLVGIPLPITGAYTGTLLAWYFGVPRKRAYLAIILGIIIAGLIVSLVVLFGIKALDIFIKYVKNNYKVLYACECVLN